MSSIFSISVTFAPDKDHVMGYFAVLLDATLKVIVVAVSALNFLAPATRSSLKDASSSENILVFH